MSVDLRGHEEEIARFVQRRVPAPDADDVVQEVFLRAVERLDQLNDPSRVRAWLFRIARNAIADAHRVLHGPPELVAESSWEHADQCIDDPRPPADTCACSAHLLLDLPYGQRAVLTLVDLEGSSLSEAAAKLAITPNNAGVRLHRARKALRARLREHCGVVDSRSCLTCRCLEDGCCPT